MKTTFAIIFLSTMLYACGSKGTKEVEKTQTNLNQSNVSEGTYDPKRGEGKFTAENVKLGSSIDPSMAKEGEDIANVKCSSCHKLSTEKLVGPGWKGVTQRRNPEWIMNFITNPDPMIDKDPEVQAQLELCLVRMPNQGLTDEDARKILEYMRKNDGIK